MRWWLLVCMVAGVVLRTAPAALGEQTPRAASRAASTDRQEAARLALDTALTRLAERRDSQGALLVSDARFPAPLAVTALGSLAWMATGNLPDRGPHASALAQSIDWLVSRTDKQTGIAQDSTDLISRMHGQGFAALALSQAYCQSPSSPRGQEIMRALESSTRCIVLAQGLEGGWWYNPEKSLRHEGSITVACLQALRGAQGAGIRVEANSVKLAIDYLERSQKPDGSFRYALGDEHSSLALTAAALASLQAAGRYEGRTLAQGFDWVVRELARREREGIEGALANDPKDGQHVSCPYYERLYLALALWQAADRRLFEDWYPRELQRVLRTREPDGCWTDERYGTSYATAMNALFLALPESLLPIFQR